MLAVGVDALVESIRDREGDGFRAMEAALESVLILAARYQDILRTQRRRLTSTGGNSWTG